MLQAYSWAATPLSINQSKPTSFALQRTLSSSKTYPCFHGDLCVGRYTKCFKLGVNSMKH